VLEVEDLDAATETFGPSAGLEAQEHRRASRTDRNRIERKDHKKAWELHHKLAALGERSVELSVQPGTAFAIGVSTIGAECYQIALDKKPRFAEAS